MIPRHRRQEPSFAVVLRGRFMTCEVRGFGSCAPEDSLRLGCDVECWGKMGPESSVGNVMLSPWHELVGR